MKIRTMRNSPLLKAQVKTNFECYLLKRYFAGPLRYNSKIGAAREMLETVVLGTDHLIQKEGSPIRISIETDHSRYQSIASAGGAGVVRGLIIYNGHKAVLRDLSVSPTLVRLAGRGIFTDHGLGAIELLDAILQEAEQVVVTPQAAAE